MNKTDSLHRENCNFPLSKTQIAVSVAVIVETALVVIGALALIPVLHGIGTIPASLCIGGGGLCLLLTASLAAHQRYKNYETPSSGPSNLLVTAATPISHPRVNALPKKLSTKNVEVLLPGTDGDLHGTFFFLWSEIGRQYATLPWPKEMKNIVVLTKVCGGRGDIVAAAKVIELMQTINPDCTIDWVVEHSWIAENKTRYDFNSFLVSKDPSKVFIRDIKSKPLTNEPGDFLILGPVNSIGNRNYVNSLIQREIRGPIFYFLENASGSTLFNRRKFLSNYNNNNSSYQSNHPLIFPAHSDLDSNHGYLSMGIAKGTGVFLDQDRLTAGLSLDYCCPTYLKKIKDKSLQKAIFEAMKTKNPTEIDYQNYSINFGYAHRDESWGKFIDCVAIHEKQKHVVIVLNQYGEFFKATQEKFQEHIFTSERLKFLKRKGYGNIFCRGEKETQRVQKANSQKGRDLTVIIRPSFAPNDVKQLQLASERLMATGDNSAAESWCARCKLYLYEDVANLGCKWRFLEQQVDLASTISPNLSQLLARFGGAREFKSSCNKVLSAEDMAEIEKLLNDPDLEKATLDFCDCITQEYSFSEILSSALKRAAWHYSVPEVAKVEADILAEDGNFSATVINYLLTPLQQRQGTNLSIEAISKIGSHVTELINNSERENYR